MKRMQKILIFLTIFIFGLAIAYAEDGNELSYGFIDHTVFSQYLTDGVYRCGYDFDEGEYYILSLHGAEALYGVSDTPNGFSWSYHRIMRKVDVKNGQYVKLLDAILVRADEINNENLKEYGTFCVGKDIPAGTYRLESITDEYKTDLQWAMGIRGAYQICNGNPENTPIECYPLFEKQTYVTLSEGQYFTINNIRATLLDEGNSTRNSEPSMNDVVLVSTTHEPTAAVTSNIIPTVETTPIIKYVYITPEPTCTPVPTAEPTPIIKYIYITPEPTITPVPTVEPTPIIEYVYITPEPDVISAEIPVVIENNTVATNIINTNSEDLGMWGITYYVDDFQQTTNEGYIANTDSIFGTFNNSAVENRELRVEWAIDKEKVALFLFEYGDNLVKAYSNRSTTYSVIMRDSLKKDIKLSATLYGNSDRLVFSNASAKKIREEFAKNGSVSFYIVNNRRKVEEYLFTMEDTSCFENAWNQLNRIVLTGNETFKQDDAGNEVLAIKRKLQELGYFSENAALNAEYTSTTTERVKLFQEKNGLAQTGVVDAVTLEVLYSGEAKSNK